MSVSRALGSKAATSRQLPRFVASGALVAAVYFTVMALLSIAAGLPDQVALAVAYGFASWDVASSLDGVSPGWSVIGSSVSTTSTK